MIKRIMAVSMHRHPRNRVTSQHASRSRDNMIDIMCRMRTWPFYLCWTIFYRQMHVGRGSIPFSGIVQLASERGSFRDLGFWPKANKSAINEAAMVLHMTYLQYFRSTSTRSSSHVEHEAWHDHVMSTRCALMLTSLIRKFPEIKLVSTREI